MIFLLSMCLAMPVQASQVLLWGVHSNTPIQYQDGSTIPLNQFDYDTEINTVMIGLYDSSFNFVDFIEFYVSSTYIDPEGRELPTHILGGVIESDLDPQEGNEAPDSSAHLPVETGYLKMEIGYEEIFLMPGGDPDNDDDWYIGDFQSFAYSDFASIEDIIAADHTYTPGSIAPPTHTPWYPTIFYTDYPIPEPSSISLFLSGLLILMLSRKRSA